MTFRRIQNCYRADQPDQHDGVSRTRRRANTKIDPVQADREFLKQSIAQDNKRNGIEKIKQRAAFVLNFCRCGQQYHEEAENKDPHGIDVVMVRRLKGRVINFKKLVPDKIDNANKQDGCGKGETFPG